MARSKKFPPITIATRPAYDCELLRKGLLQETEENDAVASDAEPAHGDD